MRRISVILKSFVVMFGVSALALAQTPDTRWFDATKENADTFWISTVEELVGLAKIVNDLDKGNDFRGKTIVLQNDIDFKDLDELVSIGTIGSVWDDGVVDVQRPFSGVFDGTVRR